MSTEETNSPMPAETTDAESEDASMKKIFISAINQALTTTHKSLAEIKQQISTYDAKFHNEVNKKRVTAEAYLLPVLTRVQASVAELKTIAAQVTETPAAQVPIGLVNSGLAKLNESLISVKERALSYDNDIKARTSSAIQSLSEAVRKPREMATLTLAEAQAKVSRTQEQALDRAAVLAGVSIDKFREQYAKYQPSVQSVTQDILGRLRGLDTQFGIVDKASRVDQSLGGYGQKILSAAGPLVDSGVAKLQEMETKVKARAQAVEAEREGEGAQDEAPAPDSADVLEEDPADVPIDDDED